MIKKARLIEENIKLKKQLYIWENIGIGTNASVQEKEAVAKDFLENNQSYTAYEVCTTIRLSRGTFYNYMNNKIDKPWFIEKEEMLTKEIVKIFEASRRLYGTEKIAIALKKKGIATTPETISRIMKKNGMNKRVIIKRPKKQVSRDRHNYYRDLLKRQFNQDAPNRVWASDFMEINVKGVKFYLCVILDLFARKVIAWRLSHKRSNNLALNTFKDAFESRKEPFNLIFHTDQGLEFKSNYFMDTLKMLGVRQSFSYPGSPNDNACMEGFYSILRKEEININLDKYENSMVIKNYLKSYFDYYNSERIHLGIGGLTPDEKESKFYL